MLKSITRFCGLTHTCQVSDITNVISGIQLSGEFASDEFGHAVADAGDFNGDGVSDLIIGVHNAAPNGLLYAGAAYVLFGSNNSNTWGDGNLQWSTLIPNKQGIKIAGEAEYNNFGYSVSNAGDFNGDGISDLMIGADAADPNGQRNTGTVYILFGSRDSNAWGTGYLQWSTIMQNKQGIKIVGEAADNYFGKSVSNAGDFNGDGVSDLMIGAPNADAAYVLFGSRDTNAWGDGNLQWSTLIPNKQGIKIVGETGNDAFGISVSNAGDFNGDGVSDLMIGADYANPNGLSNAGAAYVLFGSKDTNAWGDGYLQWSTLIPNKQGIRIAGEAENDNFGITVSTAGDFNADGISDLVIGAFQYNIDKAGAAYVLFGNSDANAWGDGYLQWSTIINNKQGIKIAGEAVGDSFGFSISTAGDFNDDGVSDLIIGAPRHNTGKPGAAYLLFGSKDSNAWGDGRLEWSTIIQNKLGFNIAGGAVDDRFGNAVSNAGDFNGDGVPDLMIGARYADPYGLNDAGSAYLVFGVGPIQAQVINNELLASLGNTTLLTPSNLLMDQPQPCPWSCAKMAVFDATHLFFEIRNPLGNFVSLTDSFTQEDINQGSIQVTHDGTYAAPSYSILIKQQIREDQWDANVVLLLKAPTLIHNRLFLNQGQSTVLTPNDLAAAYPDNSTLLSTQFHIDGVMHGVFQQKNTQGQIIHNNTTNFTQQSLIQGLVAFLHDGSTEVPSYSVSAGDFVGFFSPFQTAAVALNLSPQLELKPFIIDQALNGGDPCTLLTQDAFMAQDPDTPDEQLFFETNQQTHGVFSNVNNLNHVLSRFSNTQLLSGGVQFCHDGSDNTPAFSLRLDDTHMYSEWQAANLTLNYRPRVIRNLAPQRVVRNRLFNFSLPTNIFYDPDGDPLTYTAHILGKDGLPDGLNFNEKYRTFSGKIDTTVQEEMVVTATDTRGLSVTNTFFFLVDALELFLLKNNLNIGQGQSTRLSTDMLTSSSNIQTQYTLFIISDIQHGTFNLINPRNQSIEIANITQFSQRDIETGLIQFTHDGSPKPPQYQVRLEGHQSDPYNARVSVAFNALPLLYLNHYMMFDQGVATQLLTQFLNATDQETALINLLFEVNASTQGYFEYESNPNTPINQFPQLLLMQGSVQFRHDGSDRRPFFSVRVFDGALWSDWQNTTAALNFKPQVRHPAQDQTVLQTYSLFSKTYTFEFSLNAFGHKDSIFFDPNDAQLTITAQLPGGAPLPVWIQFDSVRYRFQGETDAVINQKIVLVAKDNRGLTAQSEFRLTSQMSDAALLSRFGEFLGIASSISLAVCGYLFWRRRITRHRRTYALANQIRKECNLHFNDFGRHLGDSFKIKIQMLISELEYKHDGFYSRLNADEKKQFAVCVAQILKDQDLIEPAPLFFGLISWVFAANRGWPNDLDLDAFESQLPDITKKAVILWNHKNPDPGFTLVYYTIMDRLKACCFSRQCCLGFRRALAGLFSKNNARTLVTNTSFSPRAKDSVSLRASSLDAVENPSPGVSDLELTTTKTHCQS